MNQEEYYVYAIYSKIYDRIYIGLSNNPIRRLSEHNTGCVKPTKPYRPWYIIYTEKCGVRINARNKEKYYKSGCGREFIKQFIPG
jgi:putative endonuclease